MDGHGSGLDWVQLGLDPYQIIFSRLIFGLENLGSERFKSKLKPVESNGHMVLKRS